MNAQGGGRQWLGWALGALLTAGLVVAVHLTVGWGPLLLPWTTVQLWIPAAGSAMVVCSYGVRTIRIQTYFRPATSGRFPGVFRLVLIHNLLNNLLPMRTGEASFPVLMARRFQVEYSRSIPALLYLRALDLHFVLMLGGLVLILHRGSMGWLLLLLLAPLPLGFFLLQESFGRRLAGQEGRMATVAKRLLEGLPSSSTLFWATWFWTGVNWLAKLLVLALILKAFSPMPFPAALVGTTTGELSSVLPFHGIAGAGTYEAGVVAGLVPLGIGLEPALQGAVNLHLFVLGVSILAGALATLIPARNHAADEGPKHS